MEDMDMSLEAKDKYFLRKGKAEFVLRVHLLVFQSCHEFFILQDILTIVFPGVVTKCFFLGICKIVI